MLEIFIRQTIDLLKKSDIQFQRTEIMPITLIHETGVKQINIQSKVSYSNVNLSDNLILQVMIMFTLLDAVIDSKYPNLEGKSFRSKYRNLPCDNDEELIFKEIYRLMKIFRNASVHSISAINFTGESVVIDYEYNNSVFKLEITKSGIGLLFAYILDSFESRNDLTDNHILAFRRSLYDHLISEIKEFSDDFKTNLQLIPSNQLRLKRSVRYQVRNPTYIIKGKDLIEITSPYLSDQPNRGVDYLVEFKGKKALIPDEILKNNQLSYRELNNWLILKKDS
ncbi:MAG: hypothetical protein PME_23720 [Priestia megaterium]